MWIPGLTVTPTPNRTDSSGGLSLLSFVLFSTSFIHSANIIHLGSSDVSFWVLGPGSCVWRRVLNGLSLPCPLLGLPLSAPGPEFPRAHPCRQDVNNACGYVHISLTLIRGQGSTYSSLFSCPAEQGQITHLALLFPNISPFGLVLSVTRDGLAHSLIHSEPLPAPLPTSSQVNLFSTFI